ncbi:hypothetical protein EMPS_07373 [Entomortierella parvispora]|uniref:Uncharacterized protein n=1 Tax=Entomortierella parvispora TaxID=205924 RepID=A0A9P3HE11_9FUNG|nr:hypothetical protein EMPS_07373 [Entomortierella parvispora]
MAARFSFGDVNYTALSHNTGNRRFWIGLLALAIASTLILVHTLFLSNPINSPPGHCATTSHGINEKKKVIGKNWIVITTINPPTDAMELLCNLEGWHVVVIAYSKSPKEWTCGSCVYLSVEEQQCLGYSIIDVVPHNAYTRKNIGYLWAVQQGATKVFDTDDDNLPTGKDIIFESPTDSLIGYRPANATGGKSVNIYSHFGRPDIWPRGFPLDDIDVRRPVAYLSEYDSIPEPARSILAPPMLIQQSLADLDPDVDAIFRLTQGQELKQARFCKKSPSLRLSPGTFSPFNSQNTLFSYDTLWGLLLPVTVSFRVCDIWRGYWVQRLLWDVNGTLGFTKPTVDQIRNAHNYHADYMDELQIYAQTSLFIDFLASWNSTSTELDTRIVDLMKAMADNDFIGAKDVELAQRWMKDLMDVGYVFPKVSPYVPEQVHLKLYEEAEPRLHLQTSRKIANDALEECQQEAESDPTMSRIQITEAQDKTFSIRFKDILMVLHLNHPVYDAIEPFLAIYAPYFPNIKIFGPNVPTHLNDLVIEVPTDAGYASYRSLTWAMERFPDYAGYLFTNDDVVLNVHQIAEFDQDKVWKHVPSAKLDVHNLLMAAPDSWEQWWRPESGELSRDPGSFTTEQRERIAAFSGIQGPIDVRSYADAVYVPKRISVELTKVLNQCLKYNVFLELALGLSLIAVEPTENWVDWTELYLWLDYVRDHWRDYLTSNISMFHPVKLTKDLKAKKELVNWIETGALPPRE